AGQRGEDDPGLRLKLQDAPFDPAQLSGTIGRGRVETPAPRPMPRRVQVRYEQAVYGSFPFWDRGYAVLAHSPGCRPEWLAGLRAACQRFGERPMGVAETAVRALFALRLASGPWMIVGVGSPGSDDRGR